MVPLVANGTSGLPIVPLATNSTIWGENGTIGITIGTIGVTLDDIGIPLVPLVEL